MIIESLGCETCQLVTANRDANHLWRQMLHALDVEETAFEFVTGAVLEVLSSLMTSTVDTDCSREPGEAVSAPDSYRARV